jgi:lipoteichoic acid synthase
MKEKIVLSIKTFVPASIFFASLFLLLRVYEFSLVSEYIHQSPYPSNIVLSGIGFDLLYALYLSSLVVVLHTVVSLVIPSAAYWLTALVFSLILLLTFCFIQYFSTTLVPLGADLFGYSFTEILHTISSSGGISWALLWVPVLILILVVGFIKLYRRAALAQTSFKGAVVLWSIFFLSWFLPHQSKPESFERDLDYYLAVNKTQYFISHAADFTRDLLTDHPPENSRYPFVRPLDYPDQLGNFLNKAEGYPNFVFVIVEGLGRNFTGPEASYSGFTPFLDSLAGKSLYWNNFLSNAGRTFGALPSILGSLPYSRDGFMSYGTNMPDHQTLVSLLKPFGYTANFFYGGNPNFDNQDVFLEYQGFDRIVDQTKFPHTEELEGGARSSWGYADNEVFSLAAKEIPQDENPRIDVFLTLSTHEPFAVPDTTFETIFHEKLKMGNWPEHRKKIITENKAIFSSLLYTDHAIRNLIRSYSTRDDFKNTIFIITGDHRLVPIPMDSKIDRYHVPLIIYSPLATANKSFGAVGVHSSITPTLLSLMKAQYGLELPNEMPFISGPLSTAERFSSDLSIALIRNKNELKDYIEGDYFLSEERLYKIGPHLSIQPEVNEKIKKQLGDKLKQFTRRLIYVCESNQWDKKASPFHRVAFSFSPSENKFIQGQRWEQMIPDSAFARARRAAFKKKYTESRLLLKYLLNRSPNYHDARILLGRTYGWESKYDSAELYVNQTLARATYYEDAFVALADIEYWQGKREESLHAIEKGLIKNPASEELLCRKARSLLLMDSTREAREILEAVLAKNPGQELAIELMDNLKKKSL